MNIYNVPPYSAIKEFVAHVNDEVQRLHDPDLRRRLGEALKEVEEWLAVHEDNEW
jgi:hypothetical protein